MDVFRTVILCVLLLGVARPAAAEGIRVEPVTLELPPAASAGVLTLRNDASVDIAVQTRVFHWVQQDGAERLDPDETVVASPPIVTLAPGADYTVRIVRTSATPVMREASYRVWVDELPDPPDQTSSGITVLVRQSIPVFFRARRATPARVSWSLRRDGSELLVDAHNQGDQHLRIASLRLRDQAGRTLSFGNGLVGYVLGRSSMTFTFRNPPRDFARDGEVAISAESNAGAVNAIAPLQAGP
jgi:fimbrial chaperone protein